ncbi:phosphohydrolase [Vibrio maerlii]|uniref:phosphohydrolase n=1 Tax=Vibrio maerlii TaxID=2231648 RepID=UPI000E3C40B0|nr:phosphohydrolase [Vibrio maerlii]
MQDFIIKKDRPRIDTLLEPYREIIGVDFAGYKNHVYRTVTYAMNFLDNDPDLEQIVETAFAYHDIGLWTDKELAYLEPSEAVALADNEKYQWGLDPEELTGAIHWHHKISPYKGNHEKVINACRKADWIDASMGSIRKGVDKKWIKEVEATFPNNGFHKTLMRLAKEYGGSVLVGSVLVTKGIVKF